jgi:hypothetical protein
MSRFGRSLILVALLSLAAALTVQADDPPAEDTSESTQPDSAESLNKGRAVIDPNG